MSCVAEVPKVLKCLRSDSAGNHLLFCLRGNFCKWWLRQKLCVFCRTLRDCRTIFTLHVCLQLPIIFKNIYDKILDESITCLVYKILKAERDYYKWTKSELTSSKCQVWNLKLIAVGVDITLITKGVRKQESSQFNLSVANSFPV